MTFDDGPSPTLTPRFIDILIAKKVSATFFVVGERVAANPDLVRRAYDAGFSIANHTWSHEHLRTLTDSEIKESLTKTQDAIRSLGVRPSGLMRPPWGETDKRVLAVVQSLGLTQTLWNVHSAEQKPATAAQILAGMTADLRPGTSNVALMHDAWAKESLTALPIFIDKARAMGYCFAKLGSRGQLLAPVPSLSVRDAKVREANLGHASFLRFVVTLTEPTSRVTSVRVRTVRGTATPYSDYQPRDFRVRLPVGVTRVVVRVRVRGDNRMEQDETLRLVASKPSGLRLGDRIAVGRIIDTD